ncbi:MAG: hypothetical protein ACFFFC_19655, partial [Candidatus Thorarchaeota archaeon]
TGFMHSYHRTIPLLGLAVILEFIFWTLGNFWPQFSELGYERWGIILILALILPVGVWAIRNIVSDYDDLFDVFDGETEENLKLYRSMDRPPSETQDEMRNLFRSKETYNSFRDGAREIIFEKWVEVGVFTSIGIVYIVIFTTSIYPKILGAAHSVYPLVILEVAGDVLSTLLMTLSISLLVVFGFGYLRTISHLGSFQDDFSVWNYIRHLRGSPKNDGSFMSYWKFIDCTSMIGKHFSRIAFRIVLLMVLAALSQLLFGPPGAVIWIIAGWSILIGILILSIPLNSLHKVMVETKNAVMKELDEEYDHLTLGFVSQLRELSRSKKANRQEEESIELATKLTALRGIIQETSQHSVWPIELPMVVRILVASLIPLLITLIDSILTLWGIIS